MSKFQSEKIKTQARKLGRTTFFGNLIFFVPHFEIALAVLVVTLERVQKGRYLADFLKLDFVQKAVEKIGQAKLDQTKKAVLAAEQTTVSKQEKNHILSRLKRMRNHFRQYKRRRKKA